MFVESYLQLCVVLNNKELLAPTIPCQVCNQDTYFIAWKITLFHHSNSDSQRSHCFNTYHPQPSDCHYMYSIFTSSLMKELFLASLLLMLMGSTVLVVVRKSTIWQTRSLARRRKSLILSTLSISFLQKIALDSPMNAVPVTVLYT